MRYHVVRFVAPALVCLLVGLVGVAGCGDNLAPPPVDADETDGGAVDGAMDCDGGSCAEPTCTDGLENGTETDVDCGGDCAPGRRCGDGLGCAAGGDCQSGVCTGQICAAPACGDGVRQGDEACDDGNHTNGDGCDDGTGGNCRPSGCGNGTRSGTEQCDDGNATNGDGCDNNCTTTGCGNGVITSGEVCDDSDAMSGDGCSATCQVEAGYTCSMVPSVCVGMCGDGVRVGTEACDDAPPAENGDGCSITCTTEPGYTCTGSPSVCTTSCGDGVRAGTEGCDDAPPAESGDGCNASCFVEPGWVCVGTPSLCFPICGDGRVVGTEACDDPAPAENGDGCSAQCLVETGYQCTGSPSVCGPRCGDGLRLPGEACDDAPPAENGDGCSATCTIESGWTCMGNMPSTCATTCGDGIRAGAELCDDAPPAENGDGCSATCTIESGYVCTGTAPSTCATVCGDGLVRPGEACDDGRNDNGDGCNAMCQVETGFVCSGEPSTCQLTCGDGVLDPGEGCDDAPPAEDGDGCNAACQPEFGYMCSGSPSVCASTCGDGLKAANEACDDAPPAENNDGCSATCTLEPGYTCSGTSPTICAPTCGDNVVVTGEACDDPAPAENGDGCSATCTIETGWYCNGSPSTCATMCGDGIPAGAEQCDDMNGVLLDGCTPLCRREPTEIEPNEDGTPQTGGSGTSGNDFDSAGGVAVANANNNAAMIPIDTARGPINVLGSIGSAGDEDVFQITNSSTNQPVSVRVDVWSRAAGHGIGVPCPSTEGMDTGLNIRTATGTIVTSNDDRNGSSDQCSALTFTLLQGQTLYIHLVEYGDNAAIPGYALQIVPTPLTCPNGVPNAGEECDDGNANDTDACRNNCTLVDGCGDGNIDGSEQCDDDNLTSGDGCSSTCNLELTCGAGETPVLVSDLSTQAIPDDQVFHDFTASVGPTGAVKRAVVFVRGITHPANAELDIQLRSPNGVVRDLSSDNTGVNYAQTMFDDTASSAITSGSAPYRGRFRPEQSLSTTAGLDFRNVGAAGAWNLQIADDTANNAGTLTGWTLGLCVDTAATFCGNSVTDPGEECDDGNSSNADTCSSTCQLLDGCGDGNIDAGEVCDDNNIASGDGCSSTCQAELQCAAGETPVLVTDLSSQAIPDDNVFHDYPANVAATGSVTKAVVFLTTIAHNNTGHLDIQLAAPGARVIRDLSSDNGTGVNYVQTLFDDSATSAITSGSVPYSGRFRPEQSLSTTAFTDFRAISAAGTWNLEIRDDTTTIAGSLNGWTLGLCVNATAPSCGDGTINGTEECDDGNTIDVDACTNLCQLTDGCGDGNLDAGEACDDNNLTSGDGCTATCQVDITCAAGETPVVVTNLTSQAIPDDNVFHDYPANIATAGGVTKAVVFFTSIAHANDDQLDIQLASPGGGVIRDLTSDNGGTNANFVQTRFDDAAPTAITSGAAPFTGRFRPEQSLTTTAFTDFRGVGAAGTWNLQVRDDAAAIAGTLNGWTLALCVNATAAFCGDSAVGPGEECDDGNTNTSDLCSNLCQLNDGCGDGNIDAGEQCDDNNLVSGDGCSSTCQLDITCAAGDVPVIVTDLTPQAIPDDNVFHDFNINVAQGGSVQKATVYIANIAHPADNHLDIQLASPTGAVVRNLSNDNGGTNANYVQTLFDDAASTAITGGSAPFSGRFRPQQSLTSTLGVDFRNLGSAGAWHLQIRDDTATMTGMLNGWSLALCVSPGANYCGDGNTNSASGEECDDGNTNNADACSNTCQIADGCGDGNFDAGEQCDDGNSFAGDGCSSTCQLDIACGPGETPVVVTNASSLSIPDANATGVLSTIDVPAAGVVRRVIAGIDVTHTYDSDLDILLVSPYGVQRELTTSNGSGVANFRRTLFSDSASTAITSGTAPYTGTFRSEESLSDAAGFGNQSAAGRWLLHVWDHGTGDTGTLNQWSVALCVDTSVTSVCGNGYVEAGETCDDGNAGAGDGCSATCQLELTCATGTPVIVRSSAASMIVTDNNTTGVSMPITVASAGTVRQAVVVLGAITHNIDGELDISLVSPINTTVDLSSGNGSSGDDYVSTAFDDTATTAVTAGAAPFRGRFRPEAALTAVNGQLAPGVWNLKVADHSGGDSGVLQSWVLGLCVE